MAKRYRRRTKTDFTGFWKPSEKPEFVPVQSWTGRYEDAYRAPKIWEPRYESYRYKSKLSDGWPWWRDPSRSEEAAVLASILNTDEIDGFLKSPVVENPLDVSNALFSAPLPVKPEFPAPPSDPTAGFDVPGPALLQVPPPPERPLAKEADYGFLNKPLGFIKRTIARGVQRELDEKYQPKYLEWQRNVERINRQNEKALADYNATIERNTIGSAEYRLFIEAKQYREDNEKQINVSYGIALSRWSAEKGRFETDAAQDARIVANLRADVRSGHTDAIEAAASIALKNSIYQSNNPTVHYDAESKILLIHYVLPDFERLEIVEPVKLRPLQGKRLTQQKDRASYSLMLRACYDFGSIFAGSPVEALALNAEVTFIDPTTGHPRTEIVGSIFSRLDDIRKLNIVNIDPKAAFKAFKGVSSGDFSRNNPIPPIYSYNKNDSRIVEGREVIGGLASEANLAAMHWEEFEHLIRQLFEMEFATNGSEVKVTRASRDSGVDAIVYDPDPIKGGKIVIQAKRYVNTVDASAVRDLFGTVQSEGANKGILITTSSFGPDSYEFVKNKPLTLLNGENLLWLLKKHGHSFSINLEAARKVLRDRGWL
jgi:restriction system protein